MTDQSAADDTKPAPAAPGLPLAQAIGTRNLLIIIVTMPLVFLIVVMATLSIFGRPGQKGEPPAVAPAHSSIETLQQPSPGRVTLPLAAAQDVSSPLLIPRGGALGAMALDGDRLALRIDTPDGGEIIVYDLALGVEIRRIALKEVGRAEL